MQFQFSQAVRITTKDGTVHLFPLGVNEVSEEVQAHAHFHHYAKCGWIADVPDDKAKPETMSERGARLAKRLEKRMKAAPKVEQVREPVQPPSPDPEPESELEEEDSGSEQVHEGVQDETLTPAQKAARTRKANAAKAAAQPKE